MKRILIASFFLIAAFTTQAQDSCYVYTQLVWTTNLKGFEAKILPFEGPQTFVDIRNEEGEKLLFHNILHALNYFSTKGWELVELNSRNPNINIFNYEYNALIRKKMSLKEAERYSTPLLDLKTAKK